MLPSGALRIADAHVDVLYRMQEEGHSFYGESALQASAERLLQAGVATQVFALFTMPTAPAGFQMELVLRQIDDYYERVVQPGVLRPVRTLADLQAARKHGEVAGVLSLEGGGCLRGRPELLRTLWRLGVRGIGLTWNHANELADGCKEPRGGGLTGAGLEVVDEAARLGIWVDFSHLSDRGVEDVLVRSKGPVMASHANCRALHGHPRNLTDEVIQELFHRKGWLGLVFEASFLGNPPEVERTDVLKHLDHVLRLGGEDFVGFGSDFDGTSNPIPGLATAADYPGLADLLVERYGPKIADKLLFQNFEAFLSRTLRP